MASRKGDETSTEAAERELGKLTDADLLRLERFARYQVYRYPSIDPQEVLGEAITRVLGGKRHWLPSVSFRVFLCGVIRSVAHDFREAAAKSQSSVRADGDVLLEGQSNPEDQAADRALLHSIWALFDGDEAVQALIRGVEAGLSAKEVQKQFGLTASEYDAARKRLERTIAKQYPNGMTI